MANGHVIAEIRAILADDDPVSAKVRDRLILAAVSEMYVKLETIAQMEVRLKAIESEREAEKKLQDERKKERTFYLRSTWGAAITTIVTLLINAVLFLFGVLPKLIGGG